MTYFGMKDRFLDGDKGADEIRKNTTDSEG